MSARRVDELVPVGMEGVVTSESADLLQINREMRKNLEGLEQGVKEAKTLVRETQSKVEELASAIGKIEDPAQEHLQNEGKKDLRESEPSEGHS